MPPSNLRFDVFSSPRSWLWRSGWGSGFLFWCAFLLALEPDNLVRAARAGAALTWSGESARIGGAALLGAGVSPAMVILLRRWPMRRDRPSRLALHMFVAAALSAGLVITAHILAAAFLRGAPCTPGALRRDLASNGCLVAFCLLMFDLLLHASPESWQQGSASAPRLDARNTSPKPLGLDAKPQQVFHVQEGAKLTLIAAEQVDWVEAQGNYVGLHVETACHLMRETLASFEAKLDPAAFVRVHRGSVIALSRARSLRRLPGGDAAVQLTSGKEVRVSRTYVKALKEKLSSLQ